MPRPNREKKTGVKPAANLPKQKPGVATSGPSADEAPGAAPPAHKGAVGVAVPVRDGSGVIKIVAVLKGGALLTKFYHIRCLGALKFALTGFVTDAKVTANGTDTYVVSLKAGLNFCGCDGWRQRHECKHINALRTLIAQDKL